ncbi:HNH endonuclease signature motif containing protein [Mumia sp. Pv 4-285]|uniref:HNH endonuclease signature motif containing protein n=1 Tax=Mumia qirimensis TaxID=3234852 RepID=UPI00351D842C
MFDLDTMDALEAALDAFAAQVVPLATDAQTCEVLRRLQLVADRIGGLQATWLEQMQDQSSYEAEGASSVAAWARRELRWDVKQTRRALAAGRTARVLPEVGAAHRRGEITQAHVDAFTLALKKADRVVITDAEEVMLDVALVCEPAELSKQLRMLTQAAHPEGLEDAWLAGMDKHDLSVAACGDGYHVRGFLDAVAGARFETWLKAACAPRGADDTRSPAQRRVDAVGDFAAAALAHGMPSERGMRPQVNVMVDADWLAGQPGAQPPVLAGWGPIGAKLFDYLSCDADRTDLLVDGATTGRTPQADILNVGRTRRLANREQRRAVRARQGGVCANPGCGGTVLELHHAAWWLRDGGRTDLDELVGLCPRCHQLIHAGRLWVEPDGQGGFVFSRRAGTRILEIEDAQRRQRHNLSQWLRTLRTLRDIPAVAEALTAATADGPVGSSMDPTADAPLGSDLAEILLGDPPPSGAVRVRSYRYGDLVDSHRQLRDTLASPHHERLIRLRT